MALALKADHFRNGSKTVLTAKNATSVFSDQLTSSAMAFKRSK
jgi:hypothetical protein